MAFCPRSTCFPSTQRCCSRATTRLSLELLCSAGRAPLVDTELPGYDSFIGDINETWEDVSTGGSSPPNQRMIVNGVMCEPGINHPTCEKTILIPEPGTLGSLAVGVMRRRALHKIKVRRLSGVSHHYNVLGVRQVSRA